MARTKVTARMSEAALEAAHAAAETPSATCDAPVSVNIKRPEFKNLENFYTYVKSNMEHVYRYRSENNFHPPVCVSIHHPSKTLPPHDATSARTVHLSNDTEFSVKCSTEEIHALFLALRNYDEMADMYTHYEKRFDVYRVGGVDDASLYSTPSNSKFALDEQVNSIDKNSPKKDEEYDNLLEQVVSRIKNNTFHYYAVIGRVHRLNIAISSTNPPDVKINIEMSYAENKPSHFENFKYELDVVEATTLMHSLGDMLSHVPAKSRGNLTTIFREDIQGGKIHDIEITSNIPEHPFEDVTQSKSQYVGVKEGNNYTRVKKNKKRQAMQAVFGWNMTGLSQVLMGKKPLSQSSNADGDGGSSSSSQASSISSDGSDSSS